ncbi:terminase small subunit [Iodobacter fluviatilis]|uniref:Terminase small subunit n=1 Tax=Iodobacter fluviatilis TaxID=537 RepID=A0A377Q8Z7_9NEIS|nr:terminase small subunit [Iodobacter fluviatilis]TCU81228.1 hypothetical protein EV682_12531 [Iodobacter fluviatilis]STQ91744.1 Uncharacterised protein [Iodobacter fluviatilis]
MDPYLSKKAFADSQGWSPSYVTKLLKTGRLILSPDGKKVDGAATLALIGKTIDPAKEGVRQRHEQARIQRDVYDEVHADRPVLPVKTAAAPLPGELMFTDFQEARTSREGYLAKLAKVEYERVCQQTVDRQAVHDAAHRYGRLLRDTLLGVPKQISSDLAAITDPWVLEQLLTERLRKTLEDVSKLGKDDMDRAMS